jgi:hypothetical protein
MGDAEGNAALRGEGENNPTCYPSSPKAGKHMKW